MEKKCKVCKAKMEVKPSRFERTKYCSKDCARIGWKGQRRSKKTEFNKGCESNRKLPIGSITVRIRKRDGKKRQWIKVMEPNKWILLCKYRWEKAYGPIDKGLVLHHIDRDTMNDSIFNLCLLSRARHMDEHRSEIAAKRLAQEVLPL
jgi:hypothetical protein